jgi:hypothetical protein
VSLEQLHDPDPPVKVPSLLQVLVVVVPLADSEQVEE